MLNFKATAKSGSPVADADTVRAVMRPFAGLGAGAFASEGAQVGAQAHGRGCGSYQPGTIGGSTVGTSTITLMARINPVTPGGLGPHPEREPKPV